LQEDLAVFSMFLWTVLFAVVSLWVSIKLAKARIGRWDSNSNGSICDVRWKFWGEAGCDVAADGRL